MKFTCSNLVSLFISSLLFLLFLNIVSIVHCRPDNESAKKEYPLRLQPELDILDIDAYLRNRRLVNLQIKCILYDGPCDVVGKWAKPRVKAGLLGECLYCTEKQKGWLAKWLDLLIKNEPELYRAGVAKFLLNSGIALPEGEIDKITRNIEQGLKNFNLSEIEIKPSSSSTTTTTGGPSPIQLNN